MEELETGNGGDPLQIKGIADLKDVPERGNRSLVDPTSPGNRSIQSDVQWSTMKSSGMSLLKQIC